MNLILFGFKGCGKTHFGQLLAEKLKRPFVDTDHILVEKFGCTAREIYQNVGERPFRSLERKAILSLSEVKDSVIGVGGGAVLDRDNVEMLQKIGKLIYLEASCETVKRRGISLAVGRLKTIYDKRKPIYESISAHHINVDHLDESAVLAQLEELAHGI